MKRKMDQSVFKNMPIWARFAALQPDGKVAFSEKRMFLHRHGQWWSPHDNAQWFVQEWPEVDFARDDWQNSLIERKGGE